MMLTGKTLFNRIDEIVELSYLTFLFELIGADILSDAQKRQLESMGLIIGQRPLIELLYILIRNRPRDGYDNAKSLQQLFDEIANTGVLPVVSDAQQATIDTAKVAFMESIESTKAELKKKIRQEIIKANKEYRQSVSVHRYVNVQKEQKKHKDYTAALVAALVLLPDLIHKNFKRVYTTNLTDFINDAVVDQATLDATLTGVPSADTQVYKKVVNDGSLCQWCRRFYMRKDGSPIIYSLSELQANGTNEGKPKSAWKPVLGATHPHCRCQLHRT